MAERQNLSRELSISRQSGLKASIEICKLNGIQPTLRELFRLTDIIATDSLLTTDDEFKKEVEKADLWIKKMRVISINKNETA
jgi:hypothetical protein